MTRTNNAVLTRRALLIELCRILNKSRSMEDTDRIPLEMRPKSKTPLRCCVHKDRAIIKYKLMAMLGYNIDDEEDELVPLSTYLAMARRNDHPTDIVLTVVNEACSSCQKGNYHVTELCKACEARPCMLNCPVQAIEIKNAQADIDMDKCIGCGKCERECPYHAIAYQPVPCEEACPVGAISKDSEGVEHIDDEKCIHCGKCITSCPFGAVIEKTYLAQIYEAMHASKDIIALVAPSISGQFRNSLPKIYGSISKLGFKHVAEVAAGAAITSEKESMELSERLENGAKFMTSSCCRVYTELVQKHLPTLRPFVSDTHTPLFYTAKMLKEQYPDAMQVFIGPCISKKHECLEIEEVDYALSFEELGAMLVAGGIEIEECANTEAVLKGNIMDHGFAVAGGVQNAISSAVPENLTTDNISGLDKKSIRQLKALVRKPQSNFLEVMSCEEGCVGGCGTLINPDQAKKLLKNAL